MTHHFYQIAHGHGLRHDPLSAIVAPRPIGWISTTSVAGVRNLAPYSFFNMFNYMPPIIGFASIGWKDSAENATATGEFVWNLVTRSLADAMNASSAMVEAGVDEFALAGLEGVPSRLVGPDRVAASPVSFECRTSQTIRLTSAAGVDTDSWLILGEVVGVHIDPAMIDDGVYQTARARPITRGGGWGDYFELSEEALFRMKRPG
ncbi:flavin reductase family protein [Sphingomonas sp. 28-62-11]|uniref:flavin reductase family protein n=1 Tax=Sphingomonas sp. 28-62-11 TaxID=1970432 RepID=UPI000BC59EB2|nr:MAG: Asp/Glu/hydantoin racemase [Sphingomonas sp. 28-62-11]